ncbi:alpha/beta fold hydrolase [Dictyobacter formicarum]|uniref:Hydrolase YraK n=1 Tax=Dictyobacter formicarum TaxID=2778368 RepID=A0ABQ3VJT1_9CHLR|nr:alpha/beta hydrolase [Dictyobacter formicarum]GHO85939.1 putative hydrolase YraK [Dictyobacter formicarum]
MNLPKSDTLPVPGATLYYEVRGAGPLLLMIAGGGGGSSFNGIASILASQYTVVTYDRRGAGRSTLDDVSADIPLETQGDDAHHLLAALTNEPAYVFGSSAGALIGLDLVARYPEQVRTLISHEPPAHYLLPDDEQQSPEKPLELRNREGASAALMKYMAQSGVRYDDLEPGVELPPLNREVSDAHAEAFFAHTFLAVRRYRLNVPALLAAPTRIVLAGAEAGHEFVAYRCAVAVAEQLGTTVVDFPSHHAGYISHPKAFAQKLSEVLQDEPAD